MTPAMSVIESKVFRAAICVRRERSFVREDTHTRSIIQFLNLITYVDRGDLVKADRITKNTQIQPAKCLRMPDFARGMCG